MPVALRVVLNEARRSEAELRVRLVHRVNCGERAPRARYDVGIRADRRLDDGRNAVVADRQGPGTHGRSDVGPDRKNGILIDRLERRDVSIILPRRHGILHDSLVVEDRRSVDDADGLRGRELERVRTRRSPIRRERLTACVSARTRGPREFVRSDAQRGPPRRTRRTRPEEADPEFGSTYLERTSLGRAPGASTSQRRTSTVRSRHRSSTIDAPGARSRAHVPNARIGWPVRWLRRRRRA